MELQERRAELDAVVRSGIFNRAPHLLRFLAYICEQYFEGRADQIKEYTIGVEALGRTPGFDPKKDSIVRVEAYRLRRRLSDYYSAAGAEHAIRIVIPSGQYVPQFLVRDTQPAQTHQPAEQRLPDPLMEQSPTPELPPPIHVNQKPHHRNWPRITALLLAVTLGAIIPARLFHKRLEGKSQPAEEIWAGPWTDPVPAEFRMLAGFHRPPFTDRQGHTWMADAFFAGGHSSSLPSDHIIERVPDPKLIRTQRSGTFRYDIPLAKGSYELHLYFAETEYGPGNSRGGGESSRTFNLSINGLQRLHDFDPLAESGAPNRLHVRVFKDISPADDGKLHISFLPSTAAAFVNAIEILSSQPGMIRPVRIVTQNRPVTDAEGRFWSADEYFLGGNLVLRRNSVLDAPEKCLYRGERYGHFGYEIPLAPGKYRLTLHFAETWFGTSESRQPAAGSRLFNVFANGVALLDNFEIVAHTGVNHALTMGFDNLQPNAQGLLSLEFVPVRNYAEVNAIEVVETD